MFSWGLSTIQTLHFKVGEFSFMSSSQTRSPPESWSREWTKTGNIFAFEGQPFIILANFGLKFDFLKNSGF